MRLYHLSHMTVILNPYWADEKVRLAANQNHLLRFYTRELIGRNHRLNDLCVDFSPLSVLPHILSLQADVQMILYTFVAEP